MVLTEYRSLVPSIHGGWLTTACKPNSKESNPPLAPGNTYTHVHMLHTQTHIHNYKIIKVTLKNKTDNLGSHSQNLGKPDATEYTSVVLGRREVETGPLPETFGLASLVDAVMNKRAPQTR